MSFILFSRETRDFGFHIFSPSSTDIITEPDSAYSVMVVHLDFYPDDQETRQINSRAPGGSTSTRILTYFWVSRPHE